MTADDRSEYRARVAAAAVEASMGAGRQRPGADAHMDLRGAVEGLCDAIGSLAALGAAGLTAAGDQEGGADLVLEAEQWTSKLLRHIAEQARAGDLPRLPIRPSLRIVE